MANDNKPPVAVKMNRAILLMESGAVQAPEAVVVAVERNDSLEGRSYSS